MEPATTEPIIPAVTTEPVAVPLTEKPKDEMVTKAELDRVLSDMHKYKNQVREMTTATQAEKETMLREQNSWQELAELKAQEAKDANEKIQKIQTSFVDEKKYSALKQAAMEAGIRKEALIDLDNVALDSVQVETTSTGRVNVLGVGQAIEGLKLSRPHWFGGQKTTVNGSLPNVNLDTNVVTAAELATLSIEAEKTGDYSVYKTKLQHFQKQKK